MKFTNSDGYTKIENGIDCYLNKPFDLTGNLYIKQISDSEDIEFNKRTIKPNRIKGNKEILIELNSLSRKFITEVLTDKNNIEMKVVLNVRKYEADNILDVYLHFNNHEPVS